MTDNELIKEEKLTETDKCMLEAIEYCCKIRIKSILKRMED